MKESGLAANSAYGVWHITYYVKTLNEFMKWAAQFDSGEDSKQYLFRGVSSADYKIDASAYRRIKKGRDNDEEQEGDFEKFLQINKDLIRDARFRGHDQKKGRKLEDLEVLAEFQHYGAATFLMDFTYNALIALWFACKKSSENVPKYGKVVAVPPNDPKFIGRAGEFSVITLESLEKKIDQLSLDNKRLYQWQPRQQQNERIIAQQSIFLFGVLEIEINPDEECLIDKSSKEEIRESLQRIYGITPDMLFPDFDGFARQYSQDVPYTQLSTTQYYQRAYEAHQRGEYKEAIDDYDMAIRLDPNDSETYHQRGLAKFQLDQHEEAIVDFDMALDRNPDNAEVYYDRGLAKYQLERDEEAIVDFDTALDRNPDNAEVYSWRAIAKFQLTELEEAIADFDMAINLQPNYANDYYYRGIVKSQLGQAEEAIADFDEAIRHNSNHATAYFNRGLMKNNLQQYELAIPDFDEAIHLESNYAQAYYHRAESKFRLHRFTEAKSDLETVLPMAVNAGNERLITEINDMLYEINSRTVGVS
ncbi:MAG: tetratricopeptide repeat protein [Candidatus Poribacteria bacterium]|nr:tetratricopeptide repeat protein [Candidatus Poribacteria bacterium]